MDIVRFVFSLRARFLESKSTNDNDKDKDKDKDKQSASTPSPDDSKQPADESKLKPLGEDEESSPDEGFRYEPSDDNVIERITIRIVKKKKKQRAYVFKIKSRKLSSEHQVKTSLRFCGIPYLEDCRFRWLVENDEPNTISLKILTIINRTKTRN